MSNLYYQNNRERIRSYQKEYFKQYYLKNKLEINANNSIRLRVKYMDKKKYTDELKRLMNLPTANDEKNLKTTLVLKKTKPKTPKASKKPPKKKEQIPSYSITKGQFVLSFD